jgi:NADH:ubiquinone oxidoreductase subunit 2 (subunit N)
VGSPFVQWAPELYIVLTLLFVFILELFNRGADYKVLNATVLLGVSSALISSFFPLLRTSEISSINLILFRDDYSQIWRVSTLVLCFLQFCLVFLEKNKRMFQEITLILGLTLVLLVFSSTQQVTLSILLFFLFGTILHRVLFLTEKSERGLDASLRFFFSYALWSLCLFGVMVVFSFYMKLPSLRVEDFSGSVLSKRALLFFLTVPVLGMLSVVPFLSWSSYVTERISSLWTPFLWMAVRILGFSWTTRILSYYRNNRSSDWIDSLAVWSTFLNGVVILNSVLTAIKVFQARSLKTLLSGIALSQISYYLLGWVLLSDQSLGLVTTDIVLEVFTVYGLYVSVLSLEKSVKIDDFKGLQGVLYVNPLSTFFFAVFLMSWMGLPLLGSINGKFFLIMEALKDGHQILGMVLSLGLFVNWYSVFKLLILMMNPNGERLAESHLDPTWSRIFQGALLLPVFIGIFLYERLFQISMQSVQLIFR